MPSVVMTGKFVSMYVEGFSVYLSLFFYTVIMDIRHLNKRNPPVGLTLVLHRSGLVPCYNPIIIPYWCSSYTITPGPVCHQEFLEWAPWQWWMGAQRGMLLDFVSYMAVLKPVLHWRCLVQGVVRGGACMCNQTPDWADPWQRGCFGTHWRLTENVHLPVVQRSHWEGGTLSMYCIILMVTGLTGATSTAFVCQ